MRTILIAESAAVIAAAAALGGGPAPSDDAAICAIVKPRTNVAVWSMGETKAKAHYRDLGERIAWNGGPIPRLVKQLVKNGEGPEARFACHKA